jgi:hypothetical protein
LSSQEIQFDACDLGVTGRQATATCQGSIHYVPKVGSPTPRSRVSAWTFDLEQTGGRWLITKVVAR